MAASSRGGADGIGASATPLDRALWRARSLLAARTIQWRDGWDASGPDPHQSLPRLPPARSPWPQLVRSSRKRQRAAAEFAGHKPRRVAISPFFGSQEPPGRSLSGPAAGREGALIRLRCPCGSALWARRPPPTSSRRPKPDPKSRSSGAFTEAAASAGWSPARAAPREREASDGVALTASSTPPRSKRPRRQTDAATLPPSPLRLLEEGVGQRPWHLLLGCALLNRTQRVQADHVLPSLVRRWPTPAALAAADKAELAAMLRHVGTHRRRAECLTRMAREWCQGLWRCPCQLTSVGPYALSAWRIWVAGDWQRCAPGDGALAMFRVWLGDVCGEQGAV